MYPRRGQEREEEWVRGKEAQYVTLCAGRHRLGIGRAFPALDSEPALDGGEKDRIRAFRAVGKGKSFLIRRVSSGGSVRSNHC